MAAPTATTIPTEPIGSIPRPVDLIEKIAISGSEDPSLGPLYEDAVRETIERFEATGSPVVTDQPVFIGVTAPVDPHIETAEEVHFVRTRQELVLVLERHLILK